MRVALYLQHIRQRTGGGSIAMWRLMEALETEGCDMRVASVFSAGSDRVHGRLVRRGPGADFFRGTDLVLTAGAATGEALRLLRQARLNVPVVAFAHSVAGDLPIIPSGVSHLVWASQAMRDYAHIRGFNAPCPESVIWPVIDTDRVRAEPGKKVTLVNLMPEKGGDLFWAIAELLPDVPFLGVLGGWRGARQVRGRTLPNVEILPFQPDPRRVFQRTRLLLYPKGRSAGAGWLHGIGMAAAEALVSGIPTIAYPGPGLVESLGEAGTWVHSFDADRWAAAVSRLLDPATYAERSAAALARSRILDPRKAAREVMAMAAPPAMAVA